MTKKPGKTRTKPPARAASRAKAAAKRRTRPTSKRDPLDDFVDAAARALDLPLEDAWRSLVREQLQTILRQADLVAEFALPDDAEPAPVFKA